MKENVRLIGIPHNYIHIDEIWNDVSPLIQKAVDYSDGCYSLGDVYTAIESRDMQLYIVIDDELKKIVCCCVTQIISYPQKKILFLVLIAGERASDWLHFSENFKKIAKAHGCSQVRGVGRKGWEKRIEPFGFKNICTVFQCDVD